MKKVLAFSAAVCLAVSAAGCGGKKSVPDTDSGINSVSTETKPPEETLPSGTASASTETKASEESLPSVESLSSEEESSPSETVSDIGDITDVIKNEGGLNYHMSKCGGFTFGISEELEIIEVDDFDIAFKTDREDSVIGMLSFSGFHNSLKGISDDMIADFNDKYTNVVYDESTVNGVPCFNITADTTADDPDETEMKIRFSALQYGNGDIFYLVYMGAAESQPQLEEYCQQLLNSIEYLGEPLKTEDETFSNEYYTVTASPMWYIEEKEKMNCLKIGLNLQDDPEDIFYEIRLNEPNYETSPKDAAESWNDTKKGVNSTMSSEIDEVEICGYDAFRVTTHTKVGETDIFLEKFFFDKDGKCMNIGFTYPNGREEEFKKDIQPILDSLEIK